MGRAATSGRIEQADDKAAAMTIAEIRQARRMGRIVFLPPAVDASDRLKEKEARSRPGAPERDPTSGLRRNLRPFRYLSPDFRAPGRRGTVRAIVQNWDWEALPVSAM
jgi:hypothetical protein